LSSIAVPTTVLLRRGWLARERSIRSVLLLSISPFAGPGDHSIQPTIWDASPGFVRSPACQASLPLWFFSCTHSPTLYFCSLSQEYTVRGGRDAKPQTVRPIKSIAHASRAAREGRRRSRGASFDTALARARVAHRGMASGARSGYFPRAYRPRKWQDVGWTSRGQYAAVLGWSASSRGLLGERQA
jgi:hypothetical protein